MLDKDLDLSQLSQEFEKLLVETPIPAAPDEEITVRLDEGERREVTILFLDMVGFTKLAEKLDPEKLKMVVSSTLQVITNQIKKFGGVVEKYIGDAVCAVFGRHESHEDDSTRAVTAATSIIDRLEDINAILSPKGISLHVRIGINCGTIVTGQIENFDTITGEAINIAQRLEAASSEDGILISKSVWKDCRDRFECEKIPPLQVKNKTEPVNAYKVIKPLPEKFRKEFKGKFVGRKNELSKLEEMWQAALNKLAFVMISGDAGIGKTRLAEEIVLKKMKGSRSSVLRGHAASFGTESYHIFADIINDYLKEGSLEDIATENLRSYLIYLKDIIHAQLTKEEKGILEAMEPKSRHIETQLAIKRFLSAVLEKEVLKGNRQLTIILDNLQWLSPLSYDTLKWLNENMEPGTPILFILCFRTQLEFNIKTAVPIELLRLSDADLGEMVEKSGIPVSDEVKKDMINRSAGNPFYLIELLKTLSGEHAGKTLPSSVKALIMSRFDRLTKPHRLIMQLASSAFDRFCIPMAASIIKRLGLDYKAEELVVDIINQGFVQASSDGHYTFSQLMIEDVVYSTILNINKTRFHGLVAEWAEKTEKDPPASYLAEQWFRSNEPAKAINYFIKAGIGAKKRYANKEAITFLEKAKELLLARHENKILERIYCDLANLYDFIGDTEKYKTTVDDGLKITASGEFHYYLELHKINIFHSKGEIETTRKLYDNFIADPETAKYPELLLRASLSRWQMAQMSHEDSARHMEQTAKLAEKAERPYLRLQVKQTLFNHYKNANDLKKAEEYLKEVDDIQSNMDPFNQHLADLFYASFYWDKQDNFDEIERRAGLSIKYFEEMGWQKGIGLGIFYKALAEWRLGKFAEAETLLKPRIDTIADADVNMRLYLALAAIFLAQNNRKDYEQLKVKLIGKVDKLSRTEVERQLTVFEGQYATDDKLEDIYKRLLTYEGSVATGVDDDEHQLTMANVLFRLKRFKEAKERCDKLYPKIKYNEKAWFLEEYQRIIDKLQRV